MKSFDEWNKIKKRTHRMKNILYCHTREIWFVRLGENIGGEQNGKGKEFLRPVIILKKFNNLIFWALSLTSQQKKGKYYFKIPDFSGRKNTAILSQIRLMDVKRLRYKIGTVDMKTFQNIKKAISEILLSDDDF